VPPTSTVLITGKMVIPQFVKAPFPAQSEDCEGNGAIDGDP
jgi:hypothetical protein